MKVNTANINSVTLDGNKEIDENNNFTYLGSIIDIERTLMQILNQGLVKQWHLSYISKALTLELYLPARN